MPVSSTVTVTGGTPAPAVPADIIGYMAPNQTLIPGQSLASGDGRYKLIMQGDGNLVLYSPNRALWSTGTHGRTPGLFAMQGDGNLVLYGLDNKPYWASWTQNTGANALYMQGDGNLVLYNSQSVPIWHTRTFGQL